MTIDPPVSTLDPSVWTFEENYDRAPAPDQFGSPSLPNLVSSSWNEFDFVFNQDGFNQPEPQTPPTPLIDFELSSTDGLEKGGKSQTEKENNQKGRDQEQDRNEHISHGRNVDCTDGALGSENCQSNQSDDTQNVEGLAQSLRIREEARGSVEPSLALASQGTSLSTPEGKEDTTDVSSGIGDQQTQTTQEGQPSSSNPAPTKRKRKPADWPGLGQIVNKVASPTEIYECLRCRAPNGTSPTRLMFLTCLFFHYGGPYAFAETGAALSILYQVEFEYPWDGGRNPHLEERLLHPFPHFSWQPCRRPNDRLLFPHSVSLPSLRFLPCNEGAILDDNSGPQNEFSTKLHHDGLSHPVRRFYATRHDMKTRAGCLLSRCPCSV